MKALLIGNLTIDHNLTESGEYIGIGGSVYFCATLLNNIGVKSTIISPYGQDFPAVLEHGIDLYPKIPLVSKTLLFRNKYISYGVREQTAENLKSININHLGFIPSSLLSGNRMVFIAPLTDQFDMSQLNKWSIREKNDLLILLPQGLFRNIDQNGRITTKSWQYNGETISQFSIIVISEKDFPLTDKTASLWNKSGPVVVVTKEEKGCTVYARGKKTDYRAFDAGQITDSTGAGDTFAAAFGYAYFVAGNISIAAEFANAAAALSLRFKSDQLKYNKEDILAFARKQGRRINL